MKNSRRVLLCPACLWVLPALLLLWVGTGEAQGATRYVAPGGVDQGTCTHPATPCGTVQYAVDISTAGDLIKVAAGEYTDVHHRPAPPEYLSPPPGGLYQVVYLDKAITIQGGYLAPDFQDPPDPQANPTILDANGQGRVLVIIGSMTPTVRGLHITGGDALGLGGGPWGLGGDVGGGVYVALASPVLEENEIFDNVSVSSGGGSDKGGGLFFDNSSALVRGNFIHNNYAYLGGGLFLANSDVTVDSNAVVTNTAGIDGAGLYLYNCQGIALSGNEIKSNSSPWTIWGGGLYVENSSVTLARNTLSQNAAYGGGGLYATGSQVLLQANTLSGNIADSYSSGLAGDSGGGVYVENSQLFAVRNVFTGNVAGDSGGGLCLLYSDTTLDGNSLFANSANEDAHFASGGGGLYYSHGSLVLNGNTFVGNSTTSRGGAIYLDSVWPVGKVAANNTVIAGNQATDRGSGIYVYGASTRLLHTTFAANRGGDGTALHVESSSTVLTNTIVVSHLLGVRSGANGHVRLTATLWGTGTWANDEDYAGGDILVGTINLWDDPGFVDPGNLDYHLRPDSAARDAGVDTSLRQDIDFQPRPYLAPDLGADEYWPPGVLKHLYLPLLTRQ